MVVFGLLMYPRHPAELPGKHKNVGTVRVRLPSATHAQVLYPCLANGGKVTQYMRSEAVDSLAALTGIPSCTFRHLDTIRSHPSPLEAPVLPRPNGSAGWPIIIFSHGTWGCEEMYTSLCRSLASYGYVVIALEHEDGSGVYAVRADGKPVPFQSPWTHDPDDATYREPMLRQRLKELEGALADLSYEGEPSSKISSHLLSVLAQCDRSSFILSGHSFGAATCALAAQELGASVRHRLLCALLFDTWAGAMSEKSRLQGVPLPLLSVESEPWAVGKWGVEQLNQNTPCAFYAPSTEHQSFSDSSLFFPTCIARKTRSLGPNERRHKLHRAVACVADAFATRARQQHNNPMDSVVLSSQMLFSTPEALLAQVRSEDVEGVLRPLHREEGFNLEEGSRAFNL